MNEHYSKKDTPFLERNGRLLFLAFIKPIINGRGYLLIYDLRKEMGKQGEWEKIEKPGKEIYAAWV